VPRGRNTENDSAGPGGIRAVGRAIAVLRAVADSTNGLKLGELARAVDLPRPTVHRIVQSLEDEGVLFFTIDGRVRTGPELTRLASTPQSALIRSAEPFMDELSHEVSEKIDLAVLERDHIRFVAQAMTSSPRLLAGVVVGDVFPAHCTAPGKVLLAQVSTKTLKLTFPDKLERYTEKTTTSREALIQQLEEIRESGLGFDLEEHSERICAVATLVEDALGGLAALTIAVPSERFYGREAALSKALLAKAAELNESLGAHPSVRGNGGGGASARGGSSGVASSA
jgi:DNA-binding IclR family transcriptional regulator